MAYSLLQTKKERYTIEEQNQIYWNICLKVHFESSNYNNARAKDPAHKKWTILYNKKTYEKIQKNKILWSYVKNFWNLSRIRNEGSRFVYANTFSSIFQSYFVNKAIKQIQWQFFFRGFMKIAYKVLKRCNFHLIKWSAKWK